MKSIDRRSFLQGAALTGAIAATGALAACSPTSPEGKGETSASSASGEAGASSTEAKSYSFEIAPDPVAESEITKTVEAEIVVIGAGVAGMVCAAAAAQDGAQVALFAASSAPVFRGGSNQGINTKVQKRYGIDYTPDNCQAYMKKQMADAAYRLDQKKWWRWIDHSVESMDWMIDIMEGAGYETTIEVGYEDPDGVFSFPPSAHNWIGGDVVDGSANGEGLVVSEMEKIILANSGTIDYNTIAKYLVREGDNKGRVSSVVATDPDGSHVKYVGTKAVVMATGDFSGDREMMEKYCPWAVDLLNEDWELNYDAGFQFGGLMPGDGQKMGLWVGAGWQRVLPNAPMILGMIAAQLPSSIGVQNYTGPNLNKNGERYMNEDTTATYSVMSVMNQPDKCAYFIWEADYANWYDEWCVGGTTISQDNGQAYVDIYLFDSLSSGAGYSSMLANEVAIENMVKRARSILSECDCETSCPNCLRHYGNKMYHTSLDRHAALDLLDYITRNEVRRMPMKSGFELFRPLVEALNQERGISCDVGEDAMRVSTCESSVSVRVVSNLVSKARNFGGLQLWESEIEHNLPNAFDLVLGAPCF